MSLLLPSPPSSALHAVELLDWALPPSPQPRSGGREALRSLLLPVFRLVGEHSHAWRAESLGFWRVGARRHWIPRLVFRQQGACHTLKLGIFAGIHGDEPAGVAAVADFVNLLNSDPAIGNGFELHVFPICNPSGFEAATRASASGLDLNREFWKGSLEPEVQILEKVLLTERYHGLVALHSDDESDGIYGFARGNLITKSLLEPALHAAEKALPVNFSSEIDGFHAVNGIIHSAYDGILSAPPGAKPEPFEIILESPTHAPLFLQRAAFVLALNEILRHYRQFMAWGGEL